jgi:hypothetical protein
MATDLLLPDGFAPSNLHLRPSVKTRYVDGDMFNICERLAEISPRLFIVEMAEGDDCSYAIMEHADHGVESLVCKVKELDARVLDRVQRMLHIPFEHRLAEIEKENAKYEADHHEDILEGMYERMGHQFRYQLEHDGFITHRGISYPKRGVAQGRKLRGEA